MTSTREVKDEKQLSGYKQSVETRYFISSMPDDNVEKIANAIRAHWGIENRLHWSLALRDMESEARLSRQG